MRLPMQVYAWSVTALALLLRGPCAVITIITDGTTIIELLLLRDCVRLLLLHYPHHMAGKVQAGASIQSHACINS